MMSRMFAIFISGMRPKPAPNSATMAAPSFAFVRDNALFGYTSPIMGQRLRLQVEHRQHELLLAERALAGVGRYNDRRQQSWQHHLDRQEQKSNDEMAAHLHRRANNPLHPQGRDTV